MKEQFMVTAHGRSGTTFLARTLNQYSSWKVDHEAIRPPPGAPGDIAHRHLIHPQMVRDWFRAKPNKYGMVNGYLRTHGHHAEVPQKAIILRDPFAVALSVHNRGNWENFQRCCEQDYYLLDWMIQQPGFWTFWFHEMFQMDSFQRIAHRLGVTDCKVTQQILSTKINQGRGRDTKLPPQRQKLIEKRLGWFREKYPCPLS